MNKKTKNNFLIDIAVPNTHNLAKTITDKQNKYQELANEICAMCKQKAVQVIPIVISSMGVIPKSLSQSLTRLNPLNTELNPVYNLVALLGAHPIVQISKIRVKLHLNTYIQLQKSVILGTCSIVRTF